MTSQSGSVTVDRHGAVTFITLDRPDALNAFDQEFTASLATCLRSAERDDAVRALVITGRGRAFSAGQDVREMAHETAERGPRAVGDQLRERFNPIVLRVRTMEKPVIAAINGVTTGAGLGVALACDYRVAAESASFVLSPIGIGLIPGAGSSALLPAIIGLGRASELALLGERITAAQALLIGMVSQVVSSEDLPAAAIAVAERFAALPTKAIGLTKRAFNNALFPNLTEHLAYEADLQEIAAATADHQEGLAAVLDKRPPMFTGA